MPSAPLGGFADPVSAVLAVTVAAAVWLRWIRVALGPLTVVLVVVSLGVTVAHLPYGDGGTYTSGWTLVETAGLLALVVVLVRRARPATASLVAVLAGVAVAGSLLRTLSPPFDAGTVAMCLFWGSLAGAAAAVGGYLRAVDARHARSVERARREQRLALAADLHDFVAHEISGMLFQAQAAQLVTSGRPDGARAALERIERAGQRALSTLDQTVHLLRADTAQGRHGWAEIHALAERYTAAGPAPVEVRIDPAIRDDEDVGEIAATVYRIVVEALTNVRRHAASATAVTVEIDRPPGHQHPATRVRVTDDAAPDPPAPPSPLPVAPAEEYRGSGLTTLARRVDGMGGTFEAGPHGTGWQVTAVLPSQPAGTREVGR